MPLTELPLRLDTPDLPPRVADLLQQADDAVNAFHNERGSRAAPGFVTSDFPLVYAALDEIAAAHLAPGPVFCEWGSGLGVVTALAALLGFDAYGIEIDPDLVDAARDLASQLELPIEFACGSFIPTGETIPEPDNSPWDGPSLLELGGAPAYDELELAVDEMDLIFVYPWPGDIQFTAELFDASAAVGALLLSFEGTDQLRLRRKIS